MRGIRRIGGELRNQRRVAAKQEAKRGFRQEFNFGAASILLEAPTPEEIAADPRLAVCEAIKASVNASPKFSAVKMTFAPAADAGPGLELGIGVVDKMLIEEAAEVLKNVGKPQMALVAVIHVTKNVDTNGIGVVVAGNPMRSVAIADLNDLLAQAGGKRETSEAIEPPPTH